MTQSVLIVDDEPDIRNLIKEILDDEGYETATASSASEAEQLINTNKPSLLLLDIWMPGMDGVSLLRKLTKKTQPTYPIVMMSGHGTIETAVEATRLGADNFIEKPLSTAKLLLTVRNALRNQNKQPSDLIHSDAYQLVGHSHLIQEVRSKLEQSADRDEAMLIVGEAGMDKQTHAHYAHSLSRRAQSPFVSVSVAKASDISVEDIVGQTSSSGLLKQALGGTLFIQDIAMLDMKVQEILHVLLRDKRYTPLDDTTTQPLTTRIIAATRYDPDSMVAAGRLHKKLFLLLKKTMVRLPPLRERPEDIPELIEFHTNLLCSQDNLPYRHCDVAVQNLLRSHGWPGNLQELRNFVHRLLSSSDEEEVGLDEVHEHLSISFKQSPGEDLLNLPLKQAREQFEKMYLTYYLQKMDHNISKVAAAIGIERTHLYRKIRQLGIRTRDQHSPS